MRSLRADDPERIGEYRLLGRLGEGGMGSVYLAQSPRGRTVAVKLVRRELADHAEFRQRFEQEVSAARRVGGEWTAPVLDADTEADPPWVATGYIPGIPLNEAVAGRKAPLPVRTLRILANRLGLALGAIHQAGLVHRDVKPSNILVTIDGPRVIDFGIARALETVAADAELTRTGAVVGSPGFMSPEQVRGDRLTGASDIFSLGSVLAFAATGHTPFGGTGVAGHVQMYRITQEEPDLDGVPEELRGLVASCLAKDPAERPSLEQLLDKTADPEGEPGPGATDSEAAEPWLPAALVAQLGRHAARLLDAEVPGAQAAAVRAAEAPVVPPPEGEGAPERDGEAAAEAPGAPGVPDISKSAPPKGPADEPGTPAEPSATAGATGTGTGDPDRGVPHRDGPDGDGPDGDGPDGDGPEGTGAGGNAASGTGAAPGEATGGRTPANGAASRGVSADGPAGAAGRTDGAEGAGASSGAEHTPGAGAPSDAGSGVHGMATVTVPAHNPQGPQGPHHPGDPQHTPPSGQWAPPPGGLPGPGGPYPVHAGPAAPHPGKRGRGVLLGALGVVLALVSGGGTFLALQVFGQGGDEGGKSGPGARRSPTADGGGTVKKPSPKDISSPAPDGALPRGYLGAWQGTVQEADGSTITRRFEIRQGDEGEVVAKTFNLRSDMLCEGEATLVSFDGGEAGLRITSRITESHPADNPCVPYKEQTLRLHADGTLSWTYPASSLSAKLHRVGDPARPVPGWMAGEWESAGASGGRTLTIGRGRAGEATLRVRDEADGGVCEFEAQLAGADGDTLSYGPQTIAHDGTDSGCGTSGSYTSTVTAVGHDQLRFTMAGESGGMVFRRAGSS